MSKVIDFQTQPEDYRHWQIHYKGPVATLLMDVDEHAGLFEGYDLKLNSYDLSVDIELADIVQRMRFEHPEVHVVVLKSAKEKVFCAGANIHMLGAAEHAHKVNFCKFTNETRNTFEAAGIESSQHYIAAIRGACAGGGYELALACDEIYLTNDNISTVALPEVSLLAILPGTGGLTRLTDKRKIRRDLADVFCSLENGVKGQRAKQWGLVDDVVPSSQFELFLEARAQAIVERYSNESDEAETQPIGINLPPLQRTIDKEGSLTYSSLTVRINREKGLVDLCIFGPTESAIKNTEQLHAEGAQTWMLRLARELDDAILHLRFNELESGVITFRTSGNLDKVESHEAFMLAMAPTDWLAREIILYWKRVLKRIDITSRSLVALIENGSCFSGFLAEILFAADRSYMMEGEFDRLDEKPAAVRLTAANFGLFPMANDITRLRTRFLGAPRHVDKIRQEAGNSILAHQAADLGLVTFIYDDIDWDDEVRTFLEERVSFSPDALTAMEANLRFAGPETMETRIFGRLSVWQNWILNRPNAVGEAGALQRYGSGRSGQFDRKRT